MESDWIDYKCKSGQTIFIYNKVTGVHKLPPGFNNGSSEDNIMYGQPVEYKELHSIATQTDDYYCNNGCTSMYINTDPHHVSNISETLPQPQQSVSVDDEHDLDNKHDPETLPQPQQSVSVDGEHDLDNEHDPENTLEDEEEQEQCQDMEEIYSIPSMLEKDAFYPGYNNSVKTSIYKKDDSAGDDQDNMKQLDKTADTSRVLEMVEFQPENNLVEKENEAKNDSVCDDKAEKKQLDEMEGCSSQHSEKPLKCSYRPNKDKYESPLIEYLRQTVGTPLECPYCERKFVYKGDLKSHLRIHTGEKPFECSYCKKKFTQISNLNRHLRIHTGEKPFECSYCKNNFAQKGDLKSHVRTHTGEKTFECSYCKKKFVIKSNLNRHLKIHTGETLFECSHCKKKFMQRSDLKRHLALH